MTKSDSPHTAYIVEPCPFCGVAMLRLPRSFNFHHPGVVTDLDCVLSGRGYYADDVKRWNTRTPDPEAAAEIKALREECRDLRMQLVATLAGTYNVAPHATTAMCGRLDESGELLTSVKETAASLHSIKPDAALKDHRKVQQP